MDNDEKKMRHDMRLIGQEVEGLIDRLRKQDASPSCTGFFFIVAGTALIEEAVDADEAVKILKCALPPCGRPLPSARSGFAMRCATTDDKHEGAMTWEWMFAA
jgi:hypothetical protein